MAVALATSYDPSQPTRPPQNENERILRELATIAKRVKGPVSKEDVEKAARPKNHPLHEYFTWDDSDAGYKYRLIEAGRLLRVRMETTLTVVGLGTAMYIHDPRLPVSESGFVETATLRSDRGLAEDALDAEFARLKGYVARIWNLASEANMMDEVEKRLKLLIKRP